jgi:hypothetical protein
MIWSHWNLALFPGLSTLTLYVTAVAISADFATASNVRKTQWNLFVKFAKSILLWTSLPNGLTIARASRPIPLPLSTYHARRSTQEENRERVQKKEQTLTLRKRKMDMPIEKREGTPLHGAVPMSYAVERFQSDIRPAKYFCNSRRWHRRHLVDCLS